MTWPDLGRRTLDVLCCALYVLCTWLWLKAWRWHVKRGLAVREEQEVEREDLEQRRWSSE